MMHFLDAGGAPAAKLKPFETGGNDYTVLDHGVLPAQMALLKLLGEWYIPATSMVYIMLWYIS